MPTLTPALLRILREEIRRGNQISEISEWLPKCELFVLLEKKFRSPPAAEADVAFRRLDDRHYWYAEYEFQAGRQVLACGFAE